MLDSNTKHPENRIHLYDPVGLINDGYGGYRPSNYAVRPRRQTVSFNNFVETTNNNNGQGLRSYNSVPDAHSTVGLRSYGSFEVDSFIIRSFNDSINSETTDDFRVISCLDDSPKLVEDRNDGGLRFAIGESSVEDDQLDAPTPRLWRSSSATSPKSLRSVQSHNTRSPKPLVNSTTSNPTSPKSTSLESIVISPSSPPHPSNSNPYSTLSNPSSPKSIVNSSSPLHPSNDNARSVNFSPSKPTSPKSVNTNTSLNSLNSNNPNYQTLSANSRTQAIAKGRKELMDMVRDLPETFYELSLKDIVEQKAVEMEMKKEIDTPEDKKPVKEVNTSKNHKETKKQKKSSKKVNKSESKKKMVRSKSVDNGKFLLKTSVFPILGSRRNKKSLSAASSFKVAPMPKSEQASNGPVKVGDKEWWRRKSCMSSESDKSNGLSSQSMSSQNSSSSSRSNSSNGRRTNRFLPSCCIFNGRRFKGKG